MALLLTPFPSIINVVGLIKIAWWWAWRVLFLVFPTLFLLIVFIFTWFTGISIIQMIRFFRWWVWRWWVFIRVPWYVHFPFCSSQSVVRVSGVGSGNIFFNWSRVNWWRCSIVCVRTNRSQVQRWSNDGIILASNIFICQYFSPSLKITFGIIVFLLTGRIHLDPSVRITILVVRMKTDLSSSDVWTYESPRFMKFGLLARMMSRGRFIRQRD